MTPAKSRWTEPAIIVAALAVLNGAYWQYQAIGRDDAKQVSAALADLGLRVRALEVTIDTRSRARDAQVQDMIGRIQRVEDRRR